MSRLSTLSATAIRAMFSSETEQAVAMLLTIYTTDGTSIAARLCDNFNKRISETDSEIVYGVRSRGNDYVFLPMEISLPSETEDGNSNCSIRFNFVTPEAIQIIREQLTGPTKILLELVLTDGTSNDVDIVEATFSGFYITSASYSADGITLNLGMINYNTEPFPAYNFTPKNFPGLF
jgi:hypothetical protein